MNLPIAPPQYDAKDQAQLRGALEREDKRNVKTGVPFTFVPVLPSYAKAALPTPSIGGMIYVTDDAGGPVPAFGDGTNWRRVTDRAVIS
jgi:hypothetical protein